MASSSTRRMAPPAICGVTRLLATGPIPRAMILPTSAADGICRPPRTVDAVPSTALSPGYVAVRVGGRASPRPNPEVTPDPTMAGMGSPFGSPASWRHDDLIGVSREFDADLALAGYAAGV